MYFFSKIEIKTKSLFEIKINILIVWAIGQKVAYIDYTKIRQTDYM